MALGESKGTVAQMKKEPPSTPTSVAVKQLQIKLNKVDQPPSVQPSISSLGRKTRNRQSLRTSVCPSPVKNKADKLEGIQPKDSIVIDEDLIFDDDFIAGGDSPAGPGDDFDPKDESGESTQSDEEIELPSKVAKSKCK